MNKFLHFLGWVLLIVAAVCVATLVESDSQMRSLAKVGTFDIVVDPPVIHDRRIYARDSRSGKLVVELSKETLRRIEKTSGRNVFVGQPYFVVEDFSGVLVARSVPKPLEPEPKG